MSDSTEAIERVMNLIAVSQRRDHENIWLNVGDVRAALALAQPVGAGEPFQARVEPWLLECFGAEIAGDKLERGDRLLEEVLELLQSGDYPPERVAALTRYTYDRPKGEPHQELGGSMVTLAAYAWAHGLDMHAAAETELARIWTKVDLIRAKQAAKPTGSALPVAPTPAPDRAGLVDEALIDGMTLADLEDLCANRLFSEGARLTLAQKAFYLIAEIKRLRAALQGPDREAGHIDPPDAETIEWARQKFAELDSPASPAGSASGWRLVPETMTPEMQTAFAVAFNAPAPKGPNPTNSLDRMFFLAQAIYAAVLSAAPTPEGE